MADPVVRAGREWMRGELADEAYFAVAYRSAYGPGWRERVTNWWRQRRG